ncbi:hypothetical protein MRX96_022868 [Rhipicephalus microplus]
MLDAFATGPRAREFPSKVPRVPFCPASLRKRDRRGASTPPWWPLFVFPFLEKSSLERRLRRYASVFAYGEATATMRVRNSSRVNTALPAFSHSCRPSHEADHAASPPLTEVGSCMCCL